MTPDHLFLRRQPGAGLRRPWVLSLMGLAVGLLMLAACASTAPETRYFRVAVPPPAPAVTTPLPVTLGVARLATPEP
ncbi:MAG TPA: hypothetical protein VLM91_12165, partial [Candidatus Methylomirabilis sp.]|nr:hypothetical protein [Candidatus Methylomirabilis sp.]